jgi:FlaA1/EpsC-like NDP-sugar epimerase
VKQKLISGILVLFDMLILAVTPYLALYIRLEGLTASPYYQMVHPYLPALVVIAIAIFYCFGLYHRLWRYAGINELLAVFFAVTVSTILQTLALLFFDSGLPRSLPVLCWFLNIALIGASRFCFRLFHHMQSQAHLPEEKVLIIGAGDSGAILARIFQERERNKRVVGFIDDDPAKLNKKLCGAKVLGDRQHLKSILSQYGINEIVIALPAAPGEILRPIIRECREARCRVKMVPGIMELLNGKLTIAQLRDVNVEDLLQREPVRLDLSHTAAYISRKKVLITGAGGSIGSELCRQIATLEPAKLVLLGKGENSIYEIEQELRMNFPRLALTPVIADIRNQERIRAVFDLHRPEVVFHAAAYKHVPLMELYPEEAVQNNVFGTKIVAEAAVRVKSEVFIMISTDKAVNPTSVMGATKRLAEQVIQVVGKESSTKFTAVRFGNVLRSRGSVIPLFEKQIAAGGPVTVTHPEMKRYFMTIPEAVQLVLEAGSLATGGEVFVLDMGEPVKIYDLACALIELAGLRPGEDIPIVFTGLRPGEKLFEELLTAEEGTTATRNQKIYRANMGEVDGARLRNALIKLGKEKKSTVIVDLLHESVSSYVRSHESSVLTS